MFVAPLSSAIYSKVVYPPFHALERTEEPSHVPQNVHKVENMTAFFRLLRRATGSTVQKPSPKMNMWLICQKAMTTKA